MTPEASKKTPGARRRRAKTAAILDEARRLLIEEGPEGMTIQRLADALDYTPGALYRYFPSKDAIIVALQVQGIGEVHGIFRRAWSMCDAVTASEGLGESEGGLLKLVASARIYIDLPAEDPVRFGLIGLAMGQPRQLLDDEAIQPIVATVMPLIGDVGQVIEAAARSGAIDGHGQGAARAVTLWSALHGVLMMKKFMRFDPKVIQARALALELGRSLLLGWGASPGGLERASEVVDRMSDPRPLLVVARELEGV